MNTKKLSLAIAGLLCAWPWAASLARLAEPFHVVYGSVRACGQEVAAGSVIEARRPGLAEPLATHVVQAPGQLFTLDLPIDSVEPRSFGFRPGEAAELSLRGHQVAGCGEAAGTVTVGQRGTFRRLDLDPAAAAIVSALSVGDSAAYEGDAGPTAIVFALTLSETSELPVTVQWVTDDANPAATAIAGADFVSASGIATIPPGDAGATFAVSLIGDANPEPNERFFVKLVSATNANLLDPLGQGTLLDDDTPPTLAVGDVTVTEPLSGSALAYFKISLSHPWDLPVTVSYATGAGTADANLDYLSLSGSVTIPAGQLSAQVGVEVLFDSQDEEDETFFLDLSAPANATLLDSQGQATIVDTIQFLFFVEQEQEGAGSVEGLTGTFAVAVSPDGHSVYVAARSADSLLLFARDPADGQLSFVRRYQDGVGGVAGLDGIEALWVGDTHVYAAGYADGAIAVFARDAASGELTFLEAEVDGQNDPSDVGGVVNGLAGAGGLAVSPDGDHLYASGFLDGAVATFSRNDDPGSPGFGRLSFLEAELDGQNDPTDAGGMVNGIAGASSVVVAGNGAFVYVTGFLDDAVALFARETSAITGNRGRLSFIEMVRDGVGGIDALAGPAAAALSPDGQHLYVAAQADNALDVFRVAADGRLTLLEAKKDGTPDASALEGIADVAVSADGKVVFAAAYFDDAVTAFRRREDPALPDFGRLATLEVKRDGIGGVDGIDGANGLGCSLDNGSVYVAGNAENALTVFARDLQAPGNPAATASQAAGTWSSQSQLRVDWSGATDSGGGSGVKGYSVVFDQAASTLPDAAVELYHAADPHSLVRTLADGSGHYFHLRTCDWSDNCTGALHLGPFSIDTTPPTAPGNVLSISHTPGIPDPANPVISMTWNAASDPSLVASGVDAYAYRFDQLSAALCDKVADSRTTVTSAGSIPLVVGTWYFHLCAVDLAGNTSPTVTVGPFYLGNDTLPPQVLQLTSVPLPATGHISPWVAPTQLRLTFDEALLDPPGDGDPADVTNPLNYLLVEAGANAIVQTAGCGALAGDDVAVAIGAIEWDAATATAAILIADGLDGHALPVGHYRLFGCATLRDLLSNRLDGNADGSGGDDFAETFEIASANLLLNPDFDHDVAAWTPSEEADFATEDADGFFSSGSLAMTNDVGPETSLSIAQCVDVSAVETDSTFLLAHRVKLDKATAGDPDAGSSIVFFAQPGCFGSQLSLQQSPPVVGDTAGAFARGELLGRVPEGAVSALVSFAAEVGPEPDYAFDAAFDSLSLTVPAPATVVFFDGFESGTTAGWSLTQP